MLDIKTLIQNAQDRKYSEFEQNALEALKAKFLSNPVLQDSLSKLAVAKGITEDCDNDEDDDMKDKMKKHKDEEEGEEGEE